MFLNELKKITLFEGQSRLIRAKINPPKATNQVVSWGVNETKEQKESTNKIIALSGIGMVDGYVNGIIYALKQGTVTITASIYEYKENGNTVYKNEVFSDTCQVTVKSKFSDMSISEFSIYLTDNWIRMTIVERVAALNYAYGKAGPYVEFKENSRNERAYINANLDTAFNKSNDENQKMLSSANVDPDTGIIYVTKSDIKNPDGSLAKIYLVAAPYALSSVGTGNPKTGGIFKLTKNNKDSYVCIADTKSDTPFSANDAPNKFDSDYMSPFGGADKNGEYPDSIELICGYYTYGADYVTAATEALNTYLIKNPNLSLSAVEKDKIFYDLKWNYFQSGGIGKFISFDVPTINWETISYAGSYY